MRHNDGKATVLGLSILLNVLLLAGFIFQGIYLRKMVERSFAVSAGEKAKLQKEILADIESNTPEVMENLKQRLKFNIDVENRYRYKIETGERP